MKRIHITNQQSMHQHPIWQIPIALLVLYATSFSKSRHQDPASDSLHVDSVQITDSLEVSHSQPALQKKDTAVYTDSTDPILNTNTKDITECTVDSFPHVPRPILYPGIGRIQDSLAQSYIRSIYQFNWSAAARTLRKLQRLERKQKRLPLSGLLGVSSRVMRILNNEYKNDKNRRQLLAEISDLRKKTLRQLKTDQLPDSLLPTAYFIRGGINGFSATLQIDENMVSAAIAGLSALQQLEKAQSLYPELHDAHLGIGLFYCMLAKAPLIVRAALNLLGPLKSFKDGLDLLRDSASKGTYTRDAAKLYLIDFLSPYWGHLVKEKNAVFTSLETTYPENPYYSFLRNHENICFHPKVLDTTLCAKPLPVLTPHNKKHHYSTNRYTTLIRLQHYWFCSDSSTRVDSLLLHVTLREFSFYPHFLKALHEQRNSSNHNVSRKIRHLTASENEALRHFGLSRMSSTRKKIYEWHMRDALRIK